MLQLRIGIFFGGATIAGLSMTSAQVFQFNLLCRRILRSSCIWHLLHEWHTRIGRMVLDICTSMILAQQLCIHDICSKIIEGVATVGVGLLAYFGMRLFLSSSSREIVDASKPPSVLVDFPDTAHFLTLEERAYVLWKKSKHFYGLQCFANRFDRVWKPRIRQLFGRRN